MPWYPHYTEQQAAKAIQGATAWTEVLDALGYAYHGKNINTVRKWAGRWGISVAHLTDHRGSTGRRPRYSDEELAAAVASSFSYAETLRRLGYCPTGGNPVTLKKRIAALGISTEHFDPYATARRLGRKHRIPLVEILVEHSTYSRGNLKRRLYESGLKARACELCGQGEIWHGKRIELILDHINGVRDDNRIGNLRIVCPNCAAGLDTHCGRQARLEVEPRVCLRCRTAFRPNRPEQRYCSRECGSRWDRRGIKLMGARRVDRPPYQQLHREIKQLGYSAVGRKYGVTDNAIRKWVRDYLREQALADGGDPDVVEIPTRTWPNRRREAA